MLHAPNVTHPPHMLTIHSGTIDKTTTAYLLHVRLESKATASVKHNLHILITDVHNIIILRHGYSC